MDQERDRMRSDPEDAQRATIDFLKAQLGGEVDEIRTHISVLLIGQNIVWKLKRAVALPYLDFSSVEARLADCERELRLNRRTAPSMYRRVIRVTRNEEGLALDGGGELVDAVVEMARFPADALFERMAKEGRLSADLLTRLANRIADLHEQAPADRKVSGAARVRSVMEGNERALREGSGVFEPPAVEDYCARSRKALEASAPLLDARAAAGAVVLGHGDLHLANVCLWEGEPTLFDCLEFDDELATVDRLYDLAFLLMDFWRLGLKAEANLVMNRYLDRIGDETGLGLLPLFLSMRAAVRAHVTARQAGGDPALGEKARGYLDLAVRLLDPAPALLLAIGGFSGSGKSTIAASVAPRIGPAPGARIVATDRIRKALFGVAAQVRLPAEAYREETTREVYRRMAGKAGEALAAGHAVVAEATFATAEARAAIAAAAPPGVAFQGVWLDADPAKLAARIAARRGDVSDADQSVLAAQLARGAGEVAWTHVDAARDAAEVTAEIAEALPRAGA
jgi:aminoglycoside phosphotransferase family enzyme/predicted kinase